MHKGCAYVSMPMGTFVLAVPTMGTFLVSHGYHGHMYEYCAYVSVPMCQATARFVLRPPRIDTTA